MNKTELVKEVAAGSGLSLTDAAKAVGATLNVIAARVQKQESVILPGFGSFYVKDRPARMCRNPRTGAQIKVAAKKVVKFRAGKGLEIEKKGSTRGKKTK